jgi:hypothetical protein
MSDNTYAMLTTTDNPWNPFTHFKEWEAFDRRSGYHTLSLLARVARVSFELSEEQQKEAVQQAIDEIVTYNLLGKYRKVYSSSQTTN